MQRRALLATAGLLPGLARAQGTAQGGDWPNKPVRIVVPFPPGGPNDLIARLYAQVLTPLIGQQVLVENRAGGSGVIGTDYALKSAPDGYTLAICDGGSLVIVPHTQATMPYKVPEEVGLVTVVAKVPEALVVHPSLGVKTLPELLEHLKRRPGRYNIATAGAAGITTLAAHSFKRQTGAEVEIVPYRGAAPAILDLVAGQVHMMFADLPPELPHIRSGAIIPVALAAQQRSPTLPELPTTAEYGFPKLLAENWYCMVAPPALPEPIMGKLTAAMRKASQDTTLRETLLAQGVEAVWTSRRDFAAQVQEESLVWRDIAKAAGVRSD